MTFKRAALPALLISTMLACGTSDGDGSAGAADTLSRAQRDSIAARLPVPGASGVGAAMRARDAAGARADAHDSIGG
jgi:hypothetical protein